MEEAREKLLGTIDDGSAANKLKEFIAAQGGDPAVVDDPELLEFAPETMYIMSDYDCYVGSIDALGVGMASLKLGGGRVTKESDVDHGVGVILHKKVGDKVEVGECIATIYARTAEEAEQGTAMVGDCIKLQYAEPEPQSFIRAIIQ